MSVDYSGLAFPKSRVKALDKADKKAALEAKDKAEHTAETVRFWRAR